MVDYTKRENKHSAVNGGAQAQAVQYDEGLRQYMLKVYNHMFAGLSVTGVVAWLVAFTPALRDIIFGTPLYWVAMFLPLGFVIYFSVRINSMTEQGAKTCFYSFAALMGLSLSSIFIAFTGASVARVFFITASVFGAMSLYGYTTKRDLTGLGSFLFMGLIGIIIASIVNIFIESSALHFAVSVIGVLIFVGLTAYDVQKIKQTYYAVGGDFLGKAAIMGALNLYLDFINLFIHLMHLIGDRR